MKFKQGVFNKFSPNSSLGFAFRNQNFLVYHHLSPQLQITKKNHHLSWFTKKREIKLQGKQIQTGCIAYKLPKTATKATGCKQQQSNEQVSKLFQQFKQATK